MDLNLKKLEDYNLRIHSFYADLLLSIRYVFDNIIFGEGTIKQYQFNIGNRSLQLKYDTQFELPSAIINYQTSDPVNYHPWLIQRTSMKNNSLLPVLYNKTKDLTLELQEELYNIVIEGTINCESQYSAIEVEHRLKSRLPIGKPLEICPFYSFFEIPQQFLEPEIFDINNDNIHNLYTKYDSNSDKIIYCFSVRYEPMIKLDVCQTSLSNTEPRSFPVNWGMTITNPVPIYLQIPIEETPVFKEPSDVYEICYCPIGLETSILQLTTKFNNHSITNWLPYFISDDNWDITIPFSLKHHDNEDSAVLTFQIDRKQYLGSFIVEIEKDEVQNKILYTETKNNKTFNLLGPIKGTLINPKYNSDNTKLTAYCNGKFDGEIINRPLSGDCELINRGFHIKTSSLIIDNYDQNDFTHDIRPLISGDIFSNIISLNPNVVDIVAEKTKISEILLYETNTNVFHRSICNETLDKYGNFLAPIQYTDSTSNQIIYATLKGKIDPRNKRFTYELLYDQSIHDFKICGIQFKFCFRKVPKYGSKYIQKINLNILPETFEPIAVGINQTFFQDQFENNIVQNNKILVRSVLISPSTTFGNDEFFIEDNGKIILRIRFDQDFDFDKKLEHHKIDSWKFMYQNDYFDQNSRLIHLSERTSNSIHNILDFEIDNDFYNDHLKFFSVSSPIFFQLYEKV